MKKLSDYKDKESEKIHQEIRAGQSKVGFSDSEWDALSVNHDVADFGLCSNCIYLIASRTKYGRIYAHCTEWDKDLNGVDLVERCNSYSKRGQMTLRDMKDIAIIIDINKKNQIGF